MTIESLTMARVHLHPKIEKLPFNSCQDEAIQAAHDCYRTKGPNLAPFLNHPISGLLNVMFDRGDLGPVFMSSGPRSFTAQIFGAEFARNCAGRETIPDRQFGLSIIDSFCEASWTLEPMLERITGKTSGYWVQFDRGLFPTLLADEIPTFVALLRPRRVLRLVPQ
ncbi:MAG: hypothetical protein AAF441_15780 [Pseudomonadota bacterium]